MPVTGHARDLAKEVIATAQERGLLNAPLTMKTRLAERLSHFELSPTPEVLTATLSAWAEVIKACRTFAESEGCDLMSGKAAMQLTQNTVLASALAAAERLLETPEATDKADGAYI